MMIRTAAVLLICLGLSACDQGDQTKATKPEKTLPEGMQKIFTPLPTDPTLAAAELEKRLNASVKVSDGLLIVNDPIWGSLRTFVLPVTTPWVVDCGILGITVVLGPTVSADREGNISNDVEVTLSPGVDSNVCDVVAPKLAKNLQAMLQGDSPLGRD